MAKTGGRHWCWGLGLVAALLTSLVGATLLVPRERVRDLIVAQVGQATGAEVEVGATAMKWWGGLGVRLEDGRMSGTGADLAAATGSPNTLGAYELVLDEADLSLSLVALLRRQVVVSGLRLQGERLEWSNADGGYEVRDFDLKIADLSWSLAAVAEQPAAPEAEPTPTGETIPEDLALKLDLTAAGVNVRGTAHAQVEVQGRLERRVLSLPSVRAELGGGAVTAEIELDYARDPWGWATFAGRAAGVPAAALLEAWAPDLARRLDCDLDVEVRGNCSLRGEAATRASLDMAGTATGTAGILHAADWLQDARPYLGDRGDLVEVRFDGLTHDFTVAEGKYQVQDLHLTGADTEWRGTGWIGLEGELDVGLHVRLPAGFTPDLGQWAFLAEGLRDDEGRVNLDFRLTGDNQRPRVTADLANLLGGTRGGSKETAADKVKKGLGGLLDKWKTK